MVSLARAGVGLQPKEKGEGGGREFRLKESVFYNLFLFIFDIIEILILKIKYFSKIYKWYTPFFIGNLDIVIVLY